MGYDFGTVLIFLIIAALFVGVSLVFGALVRPKRNEPDKATIYECGERPIGTARFNFNPRFYVIALVFIIFDVEIALTYPVAVVFKGWLKEGMGGIAFVEILTFIAILAAALAYIWGKGNLEWMREIKEKDTHK
ncbi:MAG: NAD(P)H-quinone oxidoreductase subunit 3 [Deltaproteobacteria bacterium]|nr:NAD(P)H-quinone oxidoreductase subunit 3 [Deltaproteobacteria bacterium]